MLVVDDEILVRVGIRSLLPWEDCGLEIVGEVSGGDEAIERLEELAPDVVLTDLAMRRGDGFSVIRAVKRDRPRSAVVVLSCHNEFENVREAMRLGADDYVFKLTLDPGEMIEVFARLAARYGWEPPRPLSGAAPPVSRASEPSDLGERLEPGERLLVFELDAPESMEAPLGSLVREVLRARRSPARLVRHRETFAVVIAADDVELCAIAADLRALANRYMAKRVRFAATRVSGRPVTAADAAREVSDALAQTFYDPDHLGLAPTPNADGRPALGPLVRGELERLKTALRMLDAALLHGAWEAVGFESASYFSMVFRKVVGSSPAEIRAKQKH